MSNKGKPGSRQDRRRQERQQRQQLVARQQQRQQTTRRWYFGGGILAVALLIAGGAFFAFNQNKTTTVLAGQPGGPIDGISCQAEMLNYHIHIHLTLYQNGKSVPVESQIGIPQSTAINVAGNNYCLYFLHTHDSSGIVHIESPSPKIYTLGQFFDIWHYTSLWDAQGGFGVSVNGSFVDALRKAKPGDIHVYVNGKYVGSDYKSITLTAHKLVTVELGKPLRAPETHYDFHGI